MAYKCVHCSSVFKDEAKEILTGCTCGGKFFFYIKDEKLKQIGGYEDNLNNLTITEKKQMEKDVREITGMQDVETPIFLDLESIRVVKPGKYLLDLTKLFSVNKPRIYQLEDGKYIIDLNSRGYQS